MNEATRDTPRCIRSGCDTPPRPRVAPTGPAPTYCLEHDHHYRKGQQRPCKRCGVIFRPGGGFLAYCSEACQPAKRIPPSTCAGCGGEMSPNRSKYCSRQCGEADKPPCGEPGCDRPQMSKGLCKGHWSRKYAAPRPTRVAVCPGCGRDVIKRREQKFDYCSVSCAGVDIHRDARQARAEAAEEARRQARLPVLYRRPALKNPKPLATSRVWTAGLCRACGEGFVDIMPQARYCSVRCGVRYRKRKRNRKARQRGAVGSWNWSQFIGVFLAFGRCCAYCELPIDGQPDPDHVLALARGGANSLTNLLPSCRPCNTDKNDLTLDEWASTRAHRGLPPRTTSWTDADPRVRHLMPSSPLGPPSVWRGGLPLSA